MYIKNAISPIPAYFFLFLILTIFSSCNKNDFGKIQISNKEDHYIEHYYPFIYQAEIQFLLKDYKSALHLYEQAFTQCKPLQMPMYYELTRAALSSAQLGETAKAVTYATLAFEKGEKIENFEESELFAKVILTEDWQQLKKEYPQYRAAYLQKINLELRKQMLEMKAKDQQYRADGQYNQFVQQQAELDSLNYTALIHIFEIYGYANEDLIGNYSVDGQHVDIGTILLHTPDSIRMHYFVPKIKAFVEQGKCSPDVLGSMVDQFYLYNGGLQLYGTYLGQGNKILPVQIPEKLDSLRQSIGLPIMAWQLQRDSLVRAQLGIF